MQEFACDEAADHAPRAGRGDAYARCLLDVARARPQSRPHYRTIYSPSSDSAIHSF